MSETRVSVVGRTYSAGATKATNSSEDPDLAEYLHPDSPMSCRGILTKAAAMDVELQSFPVR